MYQTNTTKPILYGITAAVLLFGVYFTVLSLVSGSGFAREQFFTFWYFIVSLTIGFGIQVGLYMYLRILVNGDQRGGRVLGVTGATSTVAMVSCCAHYLVNVLPVLGMAGVITLVAQYQVGLFWVGILFNLCGIMYIAHKVIKFRYI